MEHLSSDKYSVAWFKLAEFVSRGEKERALGLFRLLAHSFEDSALAAQLEGDLLVAFEDPTALDAYEKAACGYKETGRLLQAAAVYEHLADIAKEPVVYFKQLLELYIVLDKPRSLLMCKERMLLQDCRTKKLSFDDLCVIAQKVVDTQVQQFPERLDPFLQQLKQINEKLHKFIIDYLGH